MNRRKLLRWAGHLALAGVAQPALSALEVADETWSDAARGRDLPVRIRWPILTGNAPVKVILFSHGLGGSRFGGSVWGQAWAAAGFTVIHIQHPGSDTPAVRSSWREAMSPAQLVNRLGDVKFVLDEMVRRKAEGIQKWRSIDPQGVGMSGHSFGAHTTLGMAGQSYPGFAGVNESRLAAFIALSPTLPPANERSAFAEVKRPILCITGTLDSDVVGNGASPDRRRAVFGALPQGSKAMLILSDADHMTFAGQNGRTLEIRPRLAISREKEAAHHELVATISTNWWRSMLNHDEAADVALKIPAGLDPKDEWLRG